MTSIAQNKQLSFDFQFTKTKQKPQEDRQSFLFHPTDSTILKNIFSLKVSYNGRSYILKGKYRIETIKAFGNTEDTMSSIGYIELEKILAYKGFMYSLAFLNKNEKLKLKKVAEKILSNSIYNPNLAEA